MLSPDCVLVGNNGKTLKLIHPLIFPLRRGEEMKFIGGDVTYLAPSQMKAINLIKTEYNERLIINFNKDKPAPKTTLNVRSIF